VYGRIAAGIAREAGGRRAKAMALMRSNAALVEGGAAPGTGAAAGSESCGAVASRATAG
jgi:hypothetical protein